MHTAGSSPSTLIYKLTFWSLTQVSLSLWKNLLPKVSICSILLRSTKTPVKAQLIFSVVPPSNKGIPGMVYEKILPLECLSTTGRKMSSLRFLLSIYWTRMGLPDYVSCPEAANTTFFFKKVKKGCRKSLNMSSSTYS